MCHVCCRLDGKQEGQVRREVSGVMRQITAAVSFLPLLNDPCE